MRIHAVLLLALSFISPAVLAHQGFSFGGPDGHAPVGVMGDHTHKTGELMLSYRYMFMHMDGNRTGTNDIGTAEIVAPGGEGYVVAPLEMDTQMHMFGAMYAISNRVTLMAMLPYVEKEMDHITRSGVKFTTRSEGIGDLKTSALVGLFDTPTRSLHLNLGVSLPTGSIDERDNNPRCAMMGNCPAQLPYPMQIGSGTVDPSVGLTWRADAQTWSWGAQAGATFRLGRNDQEYSKGELYEATAWAARPVSESVSLSLRLAASEATDYDGQDEDLAVANTGFIPTAETDLRGARRANVGLGVNWAGPAGWRVAGELLYPIYQDLDGPQLESDGMLMLGVQYTRY